LPEGSDVGCVDGCELGLELLGILLDGKDVGNGIHEAHPSSAKFPFF
jgi:hypothetical protein